MTKRFAGAARCLGGRLLVTGLLSLFLLGAAGCEQEGPIEEAAEDTANAVDDARDEFEDSIDDARDEIEDAADEIDEGLDTQ